MTGSGSFKKIIAVAVALAIAAAVPLSSSAEISDELFIIACDLDGDGLVTSADARIDLRYAAGLDEFMHPTEAAIDAGIVCFGDLDGSLDHTANDARILLRLSAKLEDKSAVTVILNDPARTDSTAPSTTKAPPPTAAPITTAPTTAETTTAPVAPPKTQEPEGLPLNKLLTPYQDHGLGACEEIVVTADHAETLPPGKENDISDPSCVPYVKGTVAQVTGLEYFDGTPFYELDSGVKLSSEYVSHLTAGYRMPANSVRLAASEVTDSRTRFWFETDWIVPVNVKLGPQKYYSGYAGRTYNVSSFTADSITFTFCSTAKGEGSYDCGKDVLIKSFEWSSSSGRTELKIGLRNAGGYYGSEITVTEKGYMCLSLRHKSPGVAGKTVTLDPGHGGNDGGGGSEGVYEAPINLNVCLKAAETLRSMGANVVLTRTAASQNPSLRERADMARAADSDIFISVHCDVSESTSAHGFCPYYFYPYSFPLVSALRTEMVRAWQRVYDPGSPNYAGIDRTPRGYGFFVARVEFCPSTLIELGFLSNDIERAALQSQTTQTKLAQGIVNAVAEYFGQAMG